MQILLVLCVVAVVICHCAPADQDYISSTQTNSTNPFLQGSNDDALRKEQDKQRFQAHIQDKIFHLPSFSNTQSPPTFNRIHQLNVYPSCNRPFSAKHWDPNGNEKFQFFFPSVPTQGTSSLVPMPKTAILYLRTRNPVLGFNKASTPSSSGSTPNDLDSILDAHPSRIRVTVSYPGFEYNMLKFSVDINLSDSYPFAKIPFLHFASLWMASFERDSQMLELTASDARTNESLNIGDFFIGMDCLSSDQERGLPRDMRHADIEFMESLTNSFASINYYNNAHRTQAFTVLVRPAGLKRSQRSHAAEIRNRVTSPSEPLRQVMMSSHQARSERGQLAFDE